MPGTRKLGRKTDHRMSMLKGMVTFLLENGQIETTYTRAKEVSALTDKMITLGKQNNLAAKRSAIAFLKKEETVYALFQKIAPRFADKNGGYTSVYKIGPRRGDGAEMAIISLIGVKDLYFTEEEKKKAEKEAAKKSGKKKAKEETAEVKAAE